MLFAHGSGSSRFSRRNQAVARRLQGAGFATLLLDLSQPRRKSQRPVQLISDSTLKCCHCVSQRHRLGRDASETARDCRLDISARAPEPRPPLSRPPCFPISWLPVVSRGGRPDLAGIALAGVRAPTLLIVGGSDTVVIDLNHEALRRLRCIARLEIVPRAGHLFEESGALEKVSDLACRWFNDHLGRPTGESTCTASRSALSANQTRYRCFALVAFHCPPVAG